MRIAVVPVLDGGELFGPDDQHGFIGVGRNELPADLQAKLTAVAPKGVLSNLALQWQGQQQQTLSYLDTTDGTTAVVELSHERDDMSITVSFREK